METEILKKLSNKLLQVPTSEEDVVYILSSIRKILEGNSYPEKYSRLNFYCNLALHTKIDRLPKSIQSMLLKIKDGDPNSYQDSILNFSDLRTQLKDFITDYSLPDNIFKEEHGERDLAKLLTSIYSDTPISLVIEQRFEVVVCPDGGIRICTINP